MATRKPVIEVRRSQRRRRTVSAYRDGERIVVLIPARFSRAEEREWVDRMLARLPGRGAGGRPPGAPPPRGGGRWGRRGAGAARGRGPAAPPYRWRARRARGAAGRALS